LVLFAVKWRDDTRRPVLTRSELAAAAGQHLKHSVLHLIFARRNHGFFNLLNFVPKSSRPGGKSGQSDSSAACGARESDMARISGFERSQRLLLPEAIDDDVGAGNPVRFIDAFVDGRDLAGV
jgi:hypothetical protein